MGLATPQGKPLAFMKRGEQHERLDFLVGRWSHEERQTILEGEHTVHSESRYWWLPGEVWLAGESVIRGLPGIEALHGWFRITYDQSAGEYVRIWTDNQSAVVFLQRGDWTGSGTLELKGSHQWGGKTVYTKTVYAPVGPDEFSTEFLRSEDGEAYTRKSLARHRRSETKSAASAPSPAGSSPLQILGPLVGRWHCRVAPPFGDDPRVRRFDPDLKGNQMTIEWGLGRAVLNIAVYYKDRPQAGMNTKFIEGMALWDPATKRPRMVEYNSESGILFLGDYEVLANGDIRRDYSVSSPDGAQRRYRETWRWSSSQRKGFSWLTEDFKDGEFAPRDILVRCTADE